MKKILCFLLCCSASTAWAFDWKAPFLTPDQQGASALASNNPEKAAEHFQNNDWKGVSLYRAKNYESAATLFEKNPSADGLYNLGNAKAFAGDTDGAIAAYEAALKINPNDADAKHNLEILKKIKHEEQKQSPNKDKDSSNDKKDQKPSSASNGKSNSEKDTKPQDQNKNNSSDSSGKDPDKKQDASSKPESNADNPSQNKEEPAKSDTSQNPNQENSEKPQEANTAQSNDDEKKEDSAETANPAKEGKGVPTKADEQWLNQIPDEPGGLLKQKFLRDYLREKKNATQ